MKRFPRLGLWWGGVLVLAASLALALPLVCDKCGFESPADAAVCAHCGAELPRSGAAPATPEPTSPLPAAAATSEKLDFLDPSVVQAEIAEAQRHLGRQPELARLFLINAQALEMLTDPAAGGRRAARIKALLDECERSSMQVRIKCPVCDGTGRRKFAGATLSGQEVVRDTPGSPCTECGGSGYVARRARVEDLRFRKGRALDDYRTAQQARKYVPVGGAWVPQDLELKLTVRQQAQLRRVTAAPCPACAGIGRLDCAACRGTGRVKCPNRGCVEGKITVSASDNRIIRLKDKAEQTCPVCNGSGFVSCDKCGGRGSVLCAKCGGSGQRVLCAKCGGQGFLPCRGCLGSGRSKDGGVCAVCGGQGVELCSTCRGDGRKP